MGRWSGIAGFSACCACSLFGIFFFIVSLGFSFYMFWLWFRTFPPSISIEMFGVPALNKTSNGTFNIIDPTITFDLRLKNENLNEGVFYDTVNVTLYYYHTNISTFSPIGNTSTHAFYQGFHKKANRVESVKSYGVPWNIAKMEVLNGSTTTFRVDVDTRIRFRYMLFFLWSVNGRKYTIEVGGNISVNDQGIKSVKKGLRLSAI
ncbi:hypothetical protein MKW98_032535 [Papaver atlanticum]|uniref:Late embryogenesis abundant protein LEA-2 subgroup domain-containing protein n=1 Tax=Papaver atlanticum TaxID=357466 RepID=A0AAD4SWA3_9MAGN|nr:hypothetical protein MKW98_032535 [Papaver atlanticum]